MPPEALPVIAIDGAAASGKGTLGRAIAAFCNFAHLDTGALYRMVALTQVESATPDGGAAAAIAAARALRAAFDPAGTSNPALRSEQVGQLTSKIAAIPEVRAALLGLQRDFAASPPPLSDGRPARGAVLDGRDIGTVVCPGATVKLFVTADVTVRARRRFLELEGRGAVTSYDAVLAEMRERDTRDAERAAAPMRPAADAIIIDTTALNAMQAVAAAQAALRNKIETF